LTPDPAEVHALFARHYFYLAALASLGALQIAISIGGYSGMWLLPHRMWTRAAGILLIVAGIALFFLMPLWVDGPWAAGSVVADSSMRQWGKADWGDLGAARNVNDIDGGLSGTGQATWFPLSTLIAVIVSLGAGSLNRRLFPGMVPPRRDRAAGRGEDGLEALSGHDYPQALKQSWSKFKEDLPADASRALDESDSWSITAQLWRRFHR
jgi:hypothetical protein